MGAHVLALGPGKHEVSTEDWQRLLGPSRGGPPKRQSIAGWATELELHGYVRKVPGGVGSPRYEVVPQGDGSAAATVLQEDGSGVPLQYRTGTVEPSTVPVEDGRASTVPQGDTLQSPRGTPRARVPPPPPPPPLCARARGAIEKHGEVFGGCRGSLADYLTERVAPDEQHAYAMTVLGWIQGTDPSVWMGAGGEIVTEDRPRIIAGCLNELRTGDEVGRYFTGHPGSPKNLRAKIRYQVRSILGAKGDAKRTAPALGGDHPSMSKEQEQADIETKRERARAKGAKAATEAQTEFAERHRRELLDARVWLKEHQEAKDRVEARVWRAVSTGGRLAATEAFVEAALIQAVRAEQGGQAHVA